MSDLPPGFVLDQASAASRPPLSQGFVLDDKATKKPLEVGDVLRSIASGAGLGFADELSAAFDATVPVVGKTLARAGLVGGGQSEAPDWSARYAENLARERGIDKRISEEHPYVDAGGKIAGAVGSAVAALPRAAIAIGPSIAGNIFRTTATGAGLGAAQGFGEGEGVEDRVGRGAVGGTIGGVLGAATRPLAAVGRSIGESSLGRAVSDNVISPPLNALASLLGRSAPVPEGAAQSGALERLANMLQRSKMSVPDVENKLGRLGSQAMIADTDPQFLSAAIGAKVLPGETRNIAEDNLIPRDRTAGNRLVGAFEGGETVPSTFAARQDMSKNLGNVGAQEYGAMRAAGLQISPEMEAIMQRAPAIRDAMAQIEQDAAQYGTVLSPVDVMHRVKQTLNRNADAAFTSGKPVNKSDVGNLANEWEGAFWNANPAARAADTAYAQAASLPETMQAGRDFLRKGTSEGATDASAPALADLLINANPQQRMAARLGATNAARETALEGTAAARALARRIDESDPVRAKLIELYGPEQAGQIMRQAETEGVFANTSNKLLRGSQTAEKASDALDTMSNVGIRATPSGIVPRGTESVKAFVNWIRNPNEAVRDEIGRMTINPNASQNERTLALLAELLKRRAAGTPTSAGLAGAAGGQAGGF